MKRRDLIIGGLLAVVLAIGFLRVFVSGQVATTPIVGVDLSAADGTMEVDGVRVAIAVEPRPARPFEPLRFRFDFEPPITEARVSFNMTMDMGEHDYQLVPENGDWVATGVVLPKCGSGSRVWFGDLELSDAAGKTRRGRFRIELASSD